MNKKRVFNFNSYMFNKIEKRHCSGVALYAIYNNPTLT